ncbi:MAG: 5'/3'-nucleotidase SurE [Bacteroidota bacterium]|nr:5'/3'-nucleotidase SurE [Candidatus Kapabacteria bacterium]MCS7302284.1 5'/3'-nucleotidase SurE [Candidatus Kapabacteria bacterium]MCX7936293.1 5'/3'-nucleotidase SurE [Chlorobiota bacterium]MDW8074426.1 5'/3'-nucleotidase SurE [Bacteroidota bacterium]MDW8271098.1 5'/3'-nucleotidase SurE [Bacteroidota bacterium]
MNILVTNDDGITSQGIYSLVEALRPLGSVTVVAPDRQQSAVGHALTVSEPLRVVRFWRDEQFFGYAVSGTPADCVKLAVARLLPTKPDIVVSGINHGYNTGINVLYSGTVSAATEAMLLGIPAVAISLGTFDENADCSVAARTAAYIVERYHEFELPPTTLLNVNVPPLPEHQIKGVRITRQGQGVWNDEYEERLDPMGRPYYWLRGTYNHLDSDPNADDVAVEQGYIAITPIHYDLTDRAAIERLKERF